MQFYFSWLYFEPCMICKIKIDAFFALQQKYNGLHTQTLFQVIFSTATRNINYFGKKYRLHDFFQEGIFFPWDSLHYHLILNFHLYLKAFFSEVKFWRDYIQLWCEILNASVHESFMLHEDIKIYEVIYSVSDIEFISWNNFFKVFYRLFQSFTIWSQYQFAFYHIEIKFRKIEVISNSISKYYTSYIPKQK